MGARKLLSGRRIASLECVGRDRVVELRCVGSDAARLVFELIPRRATAMVVDAGDIVRAVWHQRRGRPPVGEPYSVPERTSRTPLDALGAEDWELLGAGPDEEAIARNLLRRVRGMSLLVAREAAARSSAGAALPEAVRAEFERAADAATEARIYAPTELDELVDPPIAADFILAPYRLQHAEERPGRELQATPFASLREAAAVFFPLRAELIAMQRARQEIRAAAASEAARLRRVLDAVSADRASLDDPATYRRRGHLLLAHPEAERDGMVARVPDDYAGGEITEIRVDPSRSLPDNAQAYYAKARRAERSAQHTRRRQAEIEKRLDEVAGIEDAAADLTDLASSRKLARAGVRHGLALRYERWATPEARSAGSASGDDSRELAREMPEGESAPGPAAGGRRKAAAGILAFTASDGSEILVGRNAAANERLSLKLAAPHDFWLHAEGPGSHVVVRNPQRLDLPAEDTLREAAALAAYFSFARGATKVNVRWTQARHVRKPRGGPKGQVILRQAATVLARPVAPEELFEV